MKIEWRSYHLFQNESIFSGSTTDPRNWARPYARAWPETPSPQSCGNPTSSPWIDGWRSCWGASASVCRRGRTPSRRTARTRSDAGPQIGPICNYCNICKIMYSLVILFLWYISKGMTLFRRDRYELFLPIYFDKARFIVVYIKLIISPHINTKRLPCFCLKNKNQLTLTRLFTFAAHRMKLFWNFWNSFNCTAPVNII